MMESRTLVVGVTSALLCAMCAALPAVGEEVGPAESEADALPPGFVRGDVVSYSYVPNKRWTLEEGKGILPYLCEYGLMKHDDRVPLETFHDENVRRIDMASQWSTMIMLYARRPEYRDELVRLMLRAYGKRQLLCLRDCWSPKDPEPYGNSADLLLHLWRHRDDELTNAEGDRATGRQLINNIAIIKLGDEGECGLGTEGLREIHEAFHDRIQRRELDGERPFAHIKAWYNMIGYWDGCYAATAEDAARGRVVLPDNVECIGTDVYQWWGHDWAPFDQYGEGVDRARVREAVDHWHDVFTRYYPEGVRMRAREPGDATGGVEKQNETHAMLGAIELAGAENAMMVFIGVSAQLCEDVKSYTTPVETMDAYYDNLKAGPWIGLVWWYFNDDWGAEGAIGYVDQTLRHRTPDNSDGEPYAPATRDALRDAFIASRMRMFHDVVDGE